MMPLTEEEHYPRELPETSLCRTDRCLQEGVASLIWAKRFLVAAAQSLTFRTTCTTYLTMTRRELFLCYKLRAASQYHVLRDSHQCLALLKHDAQGP